MSSQQDELFSSVVQKLSSCIQTFRIAFILQIIEAEMVFKVDSEGLPLEASIAYDLRHPNCLLMLGYETHVKTVRSLLCVFSSAFVSTLHQQCLLKGRQFAILNLPSGIGSSGRLVSLSIPRHKLHFVLLCTR